MNKMCQECGGKCCQGIIDVYSIDDIFYDDTLVCEYEGMEYDRVMRMGEDGKCIALKDGKCSIYNKRPEVCRAFDVGNKCCMNIYTGKIHSHQCGFCTISDALQKAKIK